jgi:transmembrane sensor
MSGKHTKTTSAVITEAADWYARLRAENVTELDAARFRAWLASDPEHRREFEALDILWNELENVETSPEVTRERMNIAARRRLYASAVNTPPVWQQGTLNRQRESPTTQGLHGKYAARPGVSRRRIIAAAAAITIAVAAGVWIQAFTAGRYVTDIGEQRTVPLADGSVVVLNTATEIRVHFTEARRGVELIRGQASFDVAKDTRRPFIVTAGGGEVRAVGTVFDVYKRADKVTVTLIEGKIAVIPGHLEPALDAGASPYEETAKQIKQDSPQTEEAAVKPGTGEIFLTAGQQLSYAMTNSSIQRTGADLPRVTAWRARKLDFDDTPLSEAIAEANRYSRAQIELDAPQLATARISGTFEAGKNELFVEGLQAYFHLDAQRTADNRIVLTAR